MNPLLLLLIGLCMGLGGGLVGLGGAIIMIPMMVLFFGENQHLYQAAALICTFSVGAASFIAHLQARTLNRPVLSWLIPTAVAAVLAGVWLSNTPLFAGRHSYLLARMFGIYLAHVAGYNLWRLIHALRHARMENPPIRPQTITRPRSIATGLVAGTASGLLGIGAGSIATPLQQMLMRIPIRNAMSNSAATVVPLALVGAIYKNLTLAQHGHTALESLKIAAFIVPTALVGGYLGGHLMHKLPRDLVRAAFIVILALAAWKLLTVQPG